MAGLRIPAGGGVFLGGAPSSALGGSSPATIVQTNYGAGSAPNEANSGVEGWHVFIGVNAAALAWLVFLRWSLPSGKRTE